MKKQIPNFQDAMKASSHWISAWDAGELSDEILADRVSELTESIEGTRGFFAVSLSSDSPLMDRLPDALVFKLREAGEIVIDITAKNLAMSTAMTIHHHRKKDFNQKIMSNRVKNRCKELLRLLDSKLVNQRVLALLEATKNQGNDVKFFNRWGYDKAQKEKIASEIISIADQ